MKPIAAFFLLPMTLAAQGLLPAELLKPLCPPTLQSPPPSPAPPPVVLVSGDGAGTGVGDPPLWP